MRTVFTVRSHLSMNPLGFGIWVEVECSNDQSLAKLTKVSQLVSWCSEPSLSKRTISRLKTNFSQSPSYSFHKSLHHKSLSLKPRLNYILKFQNANSENTVTRFGAYLYSAGTKQGNLHQLSVTMSRATFYNCSGPHRNRC